MNYRDLLARLKISDARYKFVLRNATKIIIGYGNNYEFTDDEFLLLKNYFDASSALKKAKIELGWAKSITKNGKQIHLPKYEAIKKNLIRTIRDVR